ncbi:SixA phosphatase family protein [Pontimicrobium sp. IMCC45349]|uniref:SixA phosphatase family protein n=1 Tax=Pontimicrobium sp. IMCC45349 TaxID=3391574 RepID=UPI0039A04144
MKKLYTFLLIFAFTLPSIAQEIDSTSNNDNSSTYYFIRHAEKDRSDKTNKDPNLVLDGILRAAKWSIVLDNIDFDAIYSTNYNRTKETAQPTAEKNNLDITVYDPRNIDAKSFLEQTKGKKVLVVGHSNTTPMFVNKLLGKEKYKQIDDSNNANLYIITISSSGEISDTLLVIE